MALVSAPNGDEYDLDDAVASGLVGSHDSGWTYVSDKPKPAKRVTAPDSFKSKK